MAGALERLRPKMMTVCAIMAGLLPIMRSHGTGAELMQRIAVPMIGGMVSNNSRSTELRDELAPLRVERGLLLLRCGISAR
jgi:Cu(I)/Ag(I) efflux system membrane protein CusA/SilA